MIVRDGVTRTVWLVGAWAVKVPALRYGWRFLLHGLLANLTERETWEWSGDKDWGSEFAVPRRYLAPVIWGSPGGWILIMARAQRTLTRQEFECLPTAIRWRATDLKPDNVGLFPEGARLIDYGGGWGTVEQELERRGRVG